MELLTIFLVIVIVILALANLFFWLRDHFGFQSTKTLNEERDLFNWAMSGEKDEARSFSDSPGLAESIKKVDSGWDSSSKGKDKRLKVIEKYLKGL